MPSSAARPRHWLKNGFVVAPALFSGHVLDPVPLATGRCGRGSVLPGLVGGLPGQRRRRPRRRPRRPGQASAAGRLGRPAGAGGAGGRGGAGAAAAAAAVALSTAVLAALGAYIAVNLLYSLSLKKVAVLEAMLLASGFVLRLVAGALAIPVEISHWLVDLRLPARPPARLRQAGARAWTTRTPARRATRRPSSPRRSRCWPGSPCSSYVLYTVAPETVAKFGGRGLLLTVPPVLFGVLRYLFLLTPLGLAGPHRDAALRPPAAGRGRSSGRRSPGWSCCTPGGGREEPRRPPAHRARASPRRRGPRHGARRRRARRSTRAPRRSSRTTSRGTSRTPGRTPRRGSSRARSWACARSAAATWCACRTTRWSRTRRRASA